MFAGHLGVALAAARVEPRTPVGVLAAASLLLDLLLWLFVLLGWESVVIPADFAATHQPVFDFPWSHGLAASAGWSALAGALAFAIGPRRRGARAGFVVAGMLLYLPGCGLPRSRLIALVATTLLTLGFTVIGMTVAPPPPSAAAMAASSLATIVLVSALIGWFGRGARTARG